MSAPPILPTEANCSSADRTVRAAKTASVAVLQACISMVLGLLSVPILVRSLGREAYGEWLLMLQVVSYIALVDFGNASIAKLKLASLSDDSPEPKRDILTTTLLVVLITTPVVALFGAAVSAFWFARYGGAEQSSIPFSLPVLALVASFLVMRFNSLPVFALFGSNQEYRSAFVNVVISTANSVADMIVAWSGLGTLGLAITRLTANALSGCSLHWIARKNVPWYGLSRFDWTNLTPMLQQNSLCLFAQWGYLLAESVDVLVVGLTAGAAAVPVYTITTALPRLLFMLYYQAMTGADAGMVGLFGSGNRQRFHFIRTQQEVMTAACLAIIGAPVLAVNRQFVGAWVGDAYYGGPVLTAVGVAWFFVVIVSRQYCRALNAALDFKHMAVAQVVSGVLGVGAGLVGGAVGGTIGAISALVAVRAAAAVANARRIDKLVGVSSIEHFAKVARPLALALVCCAGGWSVGGIAMPADWSTLVLTGGLTAASAAAVMWFLGMSASTRADIVGRVMHLKNRFRSLRGTVAA